MVQLEKRLQEQYDTMLAQEEMMWFQQLREQWVNFGKKNTKFFHSDYYSPMEEQSDFSYDRWHMVF